MISEWGSWLLFACFLAFFLGCVLEQNSGPTSRKSLTLPLFLFVVFVVDHFRMISPSLVLFCRKSERLQQQDDGIIPIEENLDPVDDANNAVNEGSNPTIEEQDDVEVFLSELRSSPANPSIVLPLQARKEYITNLLISRVSSTPVSCLQTIIQCSDIH